MTSLNIQSSSMFVNRDGRTIKIESREGSGTSAIVWYTVDGSLQKSKDKFSTFNSMLESGGYLDVTNLFSNFFAQNSPKVGDYKTEKEYRAEVIKANPTNVHVKFSDTNNNFTTYIYEAKDFDINTIFTEEVLSDLSQKFSSNVFEVIAEYQQSEIEKIKDASEKQRKKAEGLRFTVVGSAINADLFRKIKQAKGDIEIFQIKRLTSLDIK